MVDITNPVSWFEIPVTDMARAKAFYEAVFDIELNLQERGPLKMAWFPMNHDVPGCTGTLMQAESYIPSHAGTMVYFSVNDIEAALIKITENGGRVLNPKTAIGEYGYVAHFQDSEGNRVALHAGT